jgi:hypothetical protein
MASWCEDLSAFSFEEVVRSDADNRAWSKELRIQGHALVNRRLAKDISQDEYAADRARTHEDVAECRRRAALLSREIARRVALRPYGWHEGPVKAR